MDGETLRLVDQHAVEPGLHESPEKANVRLHSVTGLRDRQCSSVKGARSRGERELFVLRRWRAARKPQADSSEIRGVYDKMNAEGLVNDLAKSFSLRAIVKKDPRKVLRRLA